VVNITGVINGLPVPIGLPPVGAEYHFKLVPEAVSTTVPIPHLLPGPGEVTCGLSTVIITVFETAGAPPTNEQVTLNLYHVVALIVPVLPFNGFVCPGSGFHGTAPVVENSH
jgi:hypothetical protein